MMAGVSTCFGVTVGAPIHLSSELVGRSGREPIAVDGWRMHARPRVLIRETRRLRRSRLNPLWGQEARVRADANPACYTTGDSR
jgi:hypothetical protein